MECLVDNIAPVGLANRQGVGSKEIKTLWAQQAVRTGRIELRKVDGEENPADLFTKPMSSKGLTNPQYAKS